MSIEQVYKEIQKANIKPLDILSAKSTVGTASKSPSAKYKIARKTFEVRYESLKGMGELTYNVYLNKSPMTKYDPSGKLIDATPEFTKLREQGDTKTVLILLLLPILVANPAANLKTILKQVSYKNKMKLNKKILELYGGAEVSYRDKVYNLNVGVRGGEYIFVGGRKVYV